MSQSNLNMIKIKYAIIYVYRCIELSMKGVTSKFPGLHIHSHINYHYRAWSSTIVWILFLKRIEIQPNIKSIYIKTLKSSFVRAHLQSDCCRHQGSFSLTWTSIPTSIRNHTYYKVCYEITDPFPNFNGAAVEVCEWISSFISLY